MQPKNTADADTPDIPWHPAFVEALKLELEQYEDALEFHSEYPLSSEPLQIDVVVIKKAKNIVITKNIAAIFRDVNLVEYKSPKDYVSVADFYKVYGYACLYASFEKAAIENMTLSFVGSRYPRELLKHLKETRGYAVEETSAGIYTIRGDILGLQVIDSRRLDEGENLWLKELSDRVEPAGIERVLREIGLRGKAARLGSYLHALVHANAETLREVMKMSGATLTFDQVMEETGFAAKWEARGKAQGKEQQSLQVAKNMLDSGFSVEQTAKLTELDIGKVRALQRTAPLP